MSAVKYSKANKERKNNTHLVQVQKKHSCFMCVGQQATCLRQNPPAPQAHMATRPELQAVCGELPGQVGIQVH